MQLSKVILESDWLSSAASALLPRLAVPHSLCTNSGIDSEGKYSAALHEREASLIESLRTSIAQERCVKPKQISDRQVNNEWRRIQISLLPGRAERQAKRMHRKIERTFARILR